MTDDYKYLIQRKKAREDYRRYVQECGVGPCQPKEKAMSNLDREQALLKAGAQLNGLEWPRITLSDDGESVESDCPPIGWAPHGPGSAAFTIRMLQKARAQMDEMCGIPDINRRPEMAALCPRNPIAAMTCHVDPPGLTDRLPEPVPEPELVPEYPMDTARPAPVSGFPVAGVTHKFGGWGA